MQKISTKEFLPQLTEIPNPPTHLYLEGSLPSDDHIYLTVVGSRRVSPYGRDAVTHLVGALAGYPVVIVSGLALGVDGLAHRAALDAGLPTIAVPGSGLSRTILYPRTHVGLADHILSSGGGLLSEFEPDTAAAPYTFPQRNRIMAGLARAVLIIEAEELSGTLITARLATEYNRDVLIVPGSIFSQQSKGVHQLLRLGATPITKSDDLVEALGLENKTAILGTQHLPPIEAFILELLNVKPRSHEELLDKTNLSTQELSASLTTMELKGFVTESAGMWRVQG